MGLLFGNKRVIEADKTEVTPQEQRMWGISSYADLIPRRVQGKIPHVDERTAMRHSAVWACVRLRADLISTLPLDVYRNYDGVQVEVPKLPILVSPSGNRVNMLEWLYMSQMELDRTGNSIGLVREVNGIGLPGRIDLYPSSSVSVLCEGQDIVAYRIDGKVYEPNMVWHERQYTISGSPLGMSPVAYAAYQLGQYESVQDFISNWYTSGAVPRARLKNTERTISPKEAVLVKESWRAAIAMGEPFVHGHDWEYDMIQAEQVASNWLDAQQSSAIDVARFFGCPADLIDSAVQGQSVTYANISQRNLQFLIMYLGPAIIRREYALSQLIPKPRYVKLNSDALLRMDPETRAEMMRTQIESRQICPSEAREKENRPPYTPEQIAEFHEFWPPAPPKTPPKGL